MATLSETGSNSFKMMLAGTVEAGFFWPATVDGGQVPTRRYATAPWAPTAGQAGGAAWSSWQVRWSAAMQHQTRNDVSQNNSKNPSIYRIWAYLRWIYFIDSCLCTWPRGLVGVRGLKIFKWFHSQHHRFVHLYHLVVLEGHRLDSQVDMNGSCWWDLLTTTKVAAMSISSAWIALWTPPVAAENGSKLSLGWWIWGTLTWGLVHLEGVQIKTDFGGVGELNYVWLNLWCEVGSNQVMIPQKPVRYGRSLWLADMGDKLPVITASGIHVSASAMSLTVLLWHHNGPDHGIRWSWVEGVSLGH